MASERAALDSALAGNWNGIVAAVNLSGKSNKQYAGLDPGCVMTIISYENSPLFSLDSAHVQWKSTVF